MSWQIAISEAAERNTHASILVLLVLKDYLESSDGRWPKSWDDLLMAEKRQWAMYRWPEDSAEVILRVDLKFETSSKSVCRMSSNDFTAIAPKGPYYPEPCKPFVEELISTACRFDSIRN